MLKRLIGGITVSVITAFNSASLFPLSAYAGGENCVSNSAYGTCSAVVTVPGGGGGNHSSGGSSGSGGSGGSSGPRVCTSGGKVIECANYSGIWFSDHDCYATRYSGDVVDPGDGKLIYMCVAGANGTPANRLFTVDAATAPPPPPDPRVLAQQAISQMGLRRVGVGMAPPPGKGKVGVIGLPVWMWVADPGPQTTGPQTHSASASGYTVTATASLNDITWSMGDGSTVVCHGASTPYQSSYGARQSPDCGHIYRKSGDYTVTATSHWSVAWSGIGQSGTIPLQFTNTAHITQAELQAIGQR